MATREYHRETLAERVNREARIAKSVLEEIERRRNRAEREGYSFSAVTEEQLLQKLRSAKSPMIVWQSWNSGSPGSTIRYRVGIANPDPSDAIWLCGHVFVGAANIAPDISDALSAVDSRFPRLTLPAFPGLTIKAGNIDELDFELAIPVGVEKTNYMGNVVLFQVTWHDPAVYLDRGLFLFEVA